MAKGRNRYAEPAVRTRAAEHATLRLLLRRYRKPWFAEQLRARGLDMPYWRLMAILDGRFVAPAGFQEAAAAILGVPAEVLESTRELSDVAS